MFSFKCFGRVGVLVLASLIGGHAMAGVVITGTRVVYPAGQKEVTVKMNNNGKLPAFVQAWVDSGDSQSSPTNSKAPFVLSPPVARIDPSKGQTLRMMFTGANLPADKESVFFLNVLEIPPKAKEPLSLNVLQMAFRSRIKIFYRPSNLPGKPGQAVEQLQWSIVKVGSTYALRAFNPSAYYLSMVEVALVEGAQHYTAANGMVAPGESHDFDIFGLKAMPAQGAEIQFNALNDFGALIPVKQGLKP